MDTRHLFADQLCAGCPESAAFTPEAAAFQRTLAALEATPLGDPDLEHGLGLLVTRHRNRTARLDRAEVGARRRRQQEV